MCCKKHSETREGAKVFVLPARPLSAPADVSPASHQCLLSLRGTGLCFSEWKQSLPNCIFHPKLGLAVKWEVVHEHRVLCFWGNCVLFVCACL